MQRTLIHVLNIAGDLTKAYPQPFPTSEAARIQFGVSRLAELCAKIAPDKVDGLTRREWNILETDPLNGKAPKYSRISPDNFSEVAAVPLFAHPANVIPGSLDSWLQTGTQAGALLVQAALTLPPCDLLFVIPLVARRAELSTDPSRILLVTGMLAARFLQ